MNTCDTCANRDENGSCELDVLDPKGEEIPTQRIANWRNRDEFGCTEWTVITDTAKSEAA